MNSVQKSNWTTIVNMREHNFKRNGNHCAVVTVSRKNKNALDGSRFTSHVLGRQLHNY